MNPELPINSMPEAEVTLRLAFRLLNDAGSGSHADIAIDGAHLHIKSYSVGERLFQEQFLFDIASFLKSYECDSKGTLKGGWQGEYSRRCCSVNIKHQHRRQVDAATDVGRSNQGGDERRSTVSGRCRRRWSIRSRSGFGCGTTLPACDSDFQVCSGAARRRAWRLLRFRRGKCENTVADGNEAWTHLKAKLPVELLSGRRTGQSALGWR